MTNLADLFFSWLWPHKFSGVDRPKTIENITWGLILLIVLFFFLGAEVPP